MAISRVAAFFRSACTDAPYPAWEAVKDSALLSLMAEIYRRHCGKEPVVSVTHGGLECGIISEMIPRVEIVSIGPDMRGIHTTGERLCISSVQRTYEFLLAVLAAL